MGHAHDEPLGPRQIAPGVQAPIAKERVSPDQSRSLPPDQQVEALVAAYASLIQRAVRRVSGAQAELVQDDVQQIVMLGLWKQLEGGQIIDRPASYIFRAAIRATVRLLRSERLRPPLAPDRDVTLVEAGTDSDPHRQLEDKERQRALIEALETLAPRRAVAVRAHLSGFDVREIMEMFDWSYQRARHLVARGMADLRRALRERGIHE